MVQSAYISSDGNTNKIGLNFPPPRSLAFVSPHLLLSPPSHLSSNSLRPLDTTFCKTAQNPLRFLLNFKMMLCHERANFYSCAKSIRVDEQTCEVARNQSSVSRKKNNSFNVKATFRQPGWDAWVVGL